MDRGSLQSGRTQSCGCLHDRSSKNRFTTHGLCSSPLYNVYRGMLQRCYNSDASGFENYGGRGVTVCKRWRNSIEQFSLDIGPRPGYDYTLDRINSDGNYEPSNCRWANPITQSYNTRTYSTNTSGFRGVSWHKQAKKWQARIGVDNKMIYLGLFATPERAHEVYINARDEQEELYGSVSSNKILPD